MINGREYDIELFVFDKDGLLFESRQFWIELAQSRIRALEKNYPHIPREFVERWMTFMGASWIAADSAQAAEGSTQAAEGFAQVAEETVQVTDMDPMGILALAPIPEEMAVTAGYFAEHLHISWLQARAMAQDVFRTGDVLFHLERALKAQKGFPDIFQRLRKAGIPYGIATSDSKERVEQSLNLYDDYKALGFTVTANDVVHGKPSPDMLQLIQKNTGVPMEKIAMVGDSYVDVAMAKAAGAIGIGIPEEISMGERMQGVATEIVESLEEIMII